MFVVNHSIAVSVTLKKTNNFAAYALLSAFDLSIQLPNNTVTYDDNITGYDNATYVTTVTDTVNGLITFNYNPTVKGLHKLIISTGVAENYVVLGSLLLAVVEPKTVVTFNATLP